MNFFPFFRLPGFETQVTLANFLPAFPPRVRLKTTLIYALFSAHDSFKITCLGALEKNDLRVITENDFPSGWLKSHSAFLFMHPETLPEEMDVLPQITSLETQPAWRANLCIRSKWSATSFQGEFPAKMTMITRGTLVSICPLVQSADKINTICVLVNLRRTPAIKTVTVQISTMRSHTLVRSVSARTNSCTILPVPSFTARQPLVLSCTEMAAVPIYFSFADDGSALSLEHSHPPGEFLAFGGSPAVVKEMKEFWLRPKAGAPL